jgi:cytochrome c oxidase cbb3-type subunit 3
MIALGAAACCLSPVYAQRTSSTALERGKAIYEQKCAVCHGQDGRADTPVGRLLIPHPRNFADPIEMARVGADRMYNAVKGGRPGTAMAPWREILTETEIGDVIDYIRTLEPRPASQTMSLEKLSIEVGRRIYEKECASCHGSNGRAETPVARILDPPPRNLADPVAMARIDDGRAFLAISRGRPGTAMGGRGELLSPTEIIDVIRYIRTLVQPLPAGTTPAQLDVRVGEQIYRRYCIGCHGEAGNGQTPLGEKLSPRPRDFTQLSAMGNIDDQRLAQSITHGVAGTAMASWDGVLNKEDTRRVLVYIRQTFVGPARPVQTSK